jgi:hypothetical protein
MKRLNTVQDLREFIAPLVDKCPITPLDADVEFTTKGGRIIIRLSEDNITKTKES